VQGVEVAGDGLAEPDGGSCCSPSRVLADLGLRYDEPLRLPERMSITTLAVLGDTSATVIGSTYSTRRALRTSQIAGRGLSSVFPLVRANFSAAG
jgi:hypothetical protein